MWWGSIMFRAPSLYMYIKSMLSVCSALFICKFNLKLKMVFACLLLVLNHTLCTIKIAFFQVLAILIMFLFIHGKRNEFSPPKVRKWKCPIINWKWRLQTGANKSRRIGTIGSQAELFFFRVQMCFIRKTIHPRLVMENTYWTDQIMQRMLVWEICFLNLCIFLGFASSLILHLHCKHSKTTKNGNRSRKVKLKYTIQLLLLVTQQMESHILSRFRRFVAWNKLRCLFLQSSSNSISLLCCTNAT